MDEHVARALIKTLTKIEKSIESNDTTKVLRELLAKITDISAKAKGDKGDAGHTPIKGKEYRDGVDGRGISKFEIDEKGHLLVLFTDGKEKNLGRIVGKNGEDAKVDLEALAKKVLAAVKIPVPDLEKIASLAAAKIQKPATAEQIAAAIKKDVSYNDLKDTPDLIDLIKKYTAHLGPQERGVYTAPGAGGAPIAVYDEGVLISDSVQSIDFRGGNISVTDLGEGAIVVTVTGGAGANLQTEGVTGVQEGDNVRIDLTQLPNPALAFQWISRNGFILSEGAQDPDGNSTYELQGTDVLVYWALVSDRFVVNTTY